MKLLRLPMSALVVGVMALAGCVAQAPAQPAAEEVTPDGLAAGPLEQLVAPVALYPDPLLADILTAATYPLEVVQAQRWVSMPENSGLTGDALTSALNAQTWDPSVKSLVPFPKILQMMDSNLDWTQKLGEAFLAQQADVMDAVQRLRGKAYGSGNLKSGPQDVVSDAGGEISIAVPATQEIFVPAYNPWCAYGPWGYPDYPPYYFGSWGGYCGPGDGFLYYNGGLFLPFGYWEWGSFDWRGHNIWINRGHWGGYGNGAWGHSGNAWQYNPAHRGGVPFNDSRNAERYPTRSGWSPQPRAYSGYEGRAAAAPPAFEHFDSGRETQWQSERGQMSRQSMESGRSFGGGGFSGGGFGGGRGGGGRGR